jgi:hypothetical protein
MSNCSPVCARTLPASGFGACKIRPRKGGISHLVFKSCDVEVPENPVTQPGNVVNRSAWLPLLTSCKLRISPELVGQKPVGTTNSRRFASCRPEQVVSGTKTITFQDFSSPRNYLDYSFWNTIMENETAYEVGWIACDGRFYGFYNFSIYVDEVIEDSVAGVSLKEGTVTIEETRLFVPLEIRNFNSLLNEYSSYDCATSSYLYDSSSLTEILDFNNP